MQTTTATEAYEAVQKSASQSSNDERFLRVPGRVRQGDLYLDPVSPSSIEGLEETSERQLAPGTTKGSRHVARGEGVRVFLDPNRDAVTGPIVVADGRWVLEHPEHANMNLPSGCYQALYQKDLSREELARVRD